MKNKYKNILEIGTSTGHSTIWLAWAASKSGGKVTTLEIDARVPRARLQPAALLGFGDQVVDHGA